MQQPPFIEIANTFGAPVYVYDAQVITAQYERLKRAFQQVPNLRFHYAVKANSNLSVLKLMHSLGAGLDTVSIEEVRLGLLAGVAPEDIIYTPNGVSIEELEAARELGVQINIDNLSVLELFGQRYPETPVCVRINPHVMAGGNAN